MTVPTQKRHRRRWNDVLEDRALVRERKLAADLRRLWALSNSGVATPRELARMERRQQQLKEQRSYIERIRKYRIQRPGHIS